MSNPRYLSGRRFEYETKHLMERQGYTTLRTAGSHGFADIIAFNQEHIKFIQCKCVKNAEKQTKSILKEYANGLKSIQIPPYSSNEIHIKDKTTRITTIYRY